MIQKYRSILLNIQKHKSEIFASILLVTICLLPNIFFIFGGSTLSDSIIKKLGFFIISITILFIPFLFFKRKVAFIVNGIFLILAPLEIGSILLTKLPINPGYILLIFQTNFSEAKELLSSFSGILIALLLSYCLYFYIVANFIKSTYLFNNRIRIYFVLMFFSVFSMLYLYCFSLALKIETTNKKKFEYSNEIFLQKFNKIYPIDAIASIVSGKKLYDEISDFSQETSSFKFNAKAKETIAEREVYVFIIGETARYSSFSINNYKRKTTPLLEKTKSLISYEDIFSEANNTSTSLPILLTRSSATNFKVFKKEKSIIEAFKEAGFATYWIGNQSVGNAFIQQVATEADTHYFSSKDFDSVESYDQILWKYFDKILAKNENKQFIVIHTLGSHFRYNYRYPALFDKFRPSFTGAFGYDLISKENKDKLVNSYDNSILYTDFFLANTISRINAIHGLSYMYYISDHGENLFEGNVVLHGAEEPTKYDLHVPLLIWTSEEHNKKFPLKLTYLRLNKNKKLNSSITFHSLLDLANIGLNGENLSKSIASSQLKSESKRYMLNSKMQVITIK